MNPDFRIGRRGHYSQIKACLVDQDSSIEVVLMNYILLQNLANLNCPNYVTAYYLSMFSNPSIMDQYADVVDVLADVSGSSTIKSYPVTTYGYYDAYVSQVRKLDF